METLSNKDRMEQLRLFLGFSGKLVVECVGRSGGLVLFWSDQLDINLLSFSLFHIDVSVSVVRSSPWRFTGFYGSPEASQRHNAWLLLNRLYGMSSLPWICGGDFNEILMDCEKDGGLPKQRRLLFNFREALDACGLQDLGFEGPLFTWCNGRMGDAFVQERLDRYVCSRDWLSRFPASYVQHLDFWKSDHRPILLHIAVQGSVLSDRRGGRRYRFHFEESWVGMAECDQIVENNWRGLEAPVRLGGVYDNIGRCSASLGRWNSLNRASLRRGINSKRLELTSLNRSVSAGSWRDIRRVEKELDDLLLQDEIYWRQRSRVSWLKFGDRNSKFFHAKASARRKFNEILGLSDERGCWHSDLGSIHRIIGEYFSSIFSSSAPSPETLRRGALMMVALCGNLLFFRASPIDCSAVGSILDTYSRASGQETVGWSERFLVDFQAAVAVPSVRRDLVKRWLAPSPGWVKINSDVAVDVRGRRLGFGVVIRDCMGVVLVSYTSLLLGLVSSDIGEALAILLGLRLAIDMGWSTVCVESDAASVVKQLSSRVTSCSDIGLILDDILSLVVNFADLSFSSVGRSANRVAHGLAKIALSHQPVGVRLRSVPSSLALVVLDDSCGCP
ncbi:hypothetical protein ACOSQ4_022884 [Xanthoceras sorbifolium]